MRSHRQGVNGAATVPPLALYCQRASCQYPASPPSGEHEERKRLSVSRDTVAPRPATARQGTPLREILASPKMLAIMIMAAASGYPNQLTESALQAWLKDSHVSNTTIGVMSYVALPYLLKFLWAPFVDRFPIPLLGRRRGWILTTQLLLAVA